MHPAVTRTAIVLLLVGFLAASAPAGLTTADPVRLAAPFGNGPADIRATMELPRATWLNDRDGDKVFDTLEERFATTGADRLSVIVTFRHGIDFDDAMAQARDAAGPMDVRFEYRNLGGFNAPLSLDQVHSVAGLDEVRQVEWDLPGHPDMDTAAVNLGVRAVQQHFGVTGDLDGDIANATRDDVVIAIFDTGFNDTHVDLAGRFLAFFDAKDHQRKAPYDGSTHGTHVAGIAAGTGAGDAKYTGVAPGAALVGFKITEAMDYGGLEGPRANAGALWGYDTLLEIRDEYNIRVTTMSFSFGHTVDGTTSLELAADKVWDAGIVVFKSAGNDGPELGTIGIPGGARGIMTVGSLVDAAPSEDTGGPNYIPSDPRSQVPDYGTHLSVFSSRGPTQDDRIKPEIVAPGSYIVAAEEGTKDGYTAKSGTSMSAPFAAGTAALMIAADPSLTPDQVRQTMYDTADDWGAPGPDVDYGNGMLNPLAAVQKTIVDRLVRERVPYAQLEAVLDVEGPMTPFHAGGVVEGRIAEPVTFEVESTDQPLAVTVIQNTTALDVEVPPAPAVWPFGWPDPQPLRAVLVELAGPSDDIIGTVSLDYRARQQNLAFIPEETGPYELRFRNLLEDSELIWDVSAGLPPPDLVPVVSLPDPDEYGTLLSSETQADAPGHGFLMGVLACLAAAGLRRRPKRF